MFCNLQGPLYDGKVPKMTDELILTKGWYCSLSIFIIRVVKSHPIGKQIQTGLRLISVSLSNVLYCIYDISVVSQCTL